MNLADKLTVEQWPIDRLIEYARNPRKNDAVVDQMAGAIREFGFRIPIVAKSDGSVVDGHLRLKAARKLGLTEVPVALADELTDAQIKAFRLLVNRSANWSEWDTELLRLELGDLNVLGFDLTLTGFGEIELGSLLADKTEGLTDPDDAPAVPEHPVSQTGDLWLLGRHPHRDNVRAVATERGPQSGRYLRPPAPGATRPVDLWLDRLKDGGRMTLALTRDKDTGGAWFRIERRGDEFLANWILAADLFPCGGA